MLTFPTVSFFLVLSYFRGGGGEEGVAAAGEYAKKTRVYGIIKQTCLTLRSP